MAAFVAAFRPHRRLLVGGDGIAVDDFLIAPVERSVDTPPAPVWRPSDDGELSLRVVDPPAPDRRVDGAGYVLTDAAADDLQRIDDYLLANDGLEAAERVSQAIEGALDLLGEQPLIGHTRIVRVIRVLHGKRDVASILGS